MKMEIGKVLKAQGIKGEVKLACFLDDSSMLKNVKKLYLDTDCYDVVKIRCDGAFCYVSLQGVDDRNTAESLRNLTVYADKECLSLPANRYFVQDLIGCEVFFGDGTKIGEVTDVLQYGAADVFVCSSEDKEVSFPFLNDLVCSVDVDAKRITVDAKRFEEVAVYED